MSTIITPVQIEKGIPLPPPRSKFPPLPLASMEIGDSFVVPVTRSNSMRIALTSYHKKSGAKFATRSLREEKAVRVWRVA
jgi:hypothetical protein